MQVIATGANNETEAAKIARSVASSSLVKARTLVFVLEEIWVQASGYVTIGFFNQYNVLLS